mgnify:CR=1 FL=1
MNNKIKKLNQYPFSKLRELVGGSESGMLIPKIDFSIGEPKTNRPKVVEIALKENIPDISKYPTIKGTPELRSAIAEWIKNRYNLKRLFLDPENNVLPASGTRESLFGISQALYRSDSQRINIGMPNPFYQIYEGAALLSGSTPIYLNQLNSKFDLKRLSETRQIDWSKIQILYICSPANPSGDKYTLEDFDSIMHVAKANGITVISDECYSEIYRPSSKPPTGLFEWCEETGNTSFENCIVMNSLSKRSGLPGLRSGFIAGDEKILKTFLQYRSYQGVAMPLHVQKASIAAWKDETHVHKNRDYYTENFNAASEIFRDIHNYEEPEAGFFIWLKIPVCDLEFAKGLYNTHKVLVMPGSFLARHSFGMNPGSKYIRIALVHDKKKCAEGLEQIKDYLVQIQG